MASLNRALQWKCFHVTLYPAEARGPQPGAPHCGRMHQAGGGGGGEGDEWREDQRGGEERELREKVGSRVGDADLSSAMLC